MDSFYARLGIVLLGTVMDGDCGIDTACMMLGLPPHISKSQCTSTGDRRLLVGPRGEALVASIASGVRGIACGGLGTLPQLRCG